MCNIVYIVRVFCELNCHMRLKKQITHYLTHGISYKA